MEDAYEGENEESCSLFIEAGFPDAVKPGEEKRRIPQNEDSVIDINSCAINLRVI